MAIMTRIHDVYGNVTNEIMWPNDNDAKAFMFDAMNEIDIVNGVEVEYICWLVDCATCKKFGQYDIYDIYPRAI